MMKFAPTNLNFKVKFRVKERGMRILRSNELGHIVKDGQAELQIWEFMRIFGDSMTIGFDPPVDTKVEIEVLDGE